MNACVSFEGGELPSVQSCLTLSKPVTWNQRASERREQEGGRGDETETVRKSFFYFIYLFIFLKKGGASHSTE